MATASPKLITRLSAEQPIVVPPLNIRVNNEVIDGSRGSGLREGSRGSGLRAQAAHKLVARRSGELAPDGLSYSTNDRPLHSRVGNLKSYRSSGMESDDSRRSGNFTRPSSMGKAGELATNSPKRSLELGTGRPGSGLLKGSEQSPKRAIDANQGGFFPDSPNLSSGRKMDHSHRIMLTTSGGSMERIPSQRITSSPRPGYSDRVQSQKGLLAGEKELVRVVSQRAMVTQIADKYLHNLEQQRTQPSKAREEAEALRNKKKAVRRMLGSFSMYQIDGFLQEDEPKQESASTSVEQMPLKGPPIHKITSRRLSVPEATSILDDEYEVALTKLIEKRILSKAFLMWRTVVAYRAYIKAVQDQRLPFMPKAIGRRRSHVRRMPAPQSQFSRASRLSVVRRPSTELPNMDEPHPEWFNLGTRARAQEEHRHQLNMGRRQTRTSRKSIFEAPSGHAGEVRFRKSVFQSPPNLPPPVPEHRRPTVRTAVTAKGHAPPKSPINGLEELASTTPAQVGLKLPPAMSITVVAQPRGLQRKMSWGKKGMDVIKNIFASPGNKILSRIPSKEKMFDRKSSKEKLVE